MAEVWLLVSWCIVLSTVQGSHMVSDFDHTYTTDKKQAAQFDGVTIDPPVKWDCGATLSGPRGEFQLPTSDLNGTHIYHSNYKCRWSIAVTSGKAIMLSSLYFHLEESPSGCEWDYLEIREEFDRKSETTSILCGHYPVTYISITDRMFLYFRSDDSYENMGFHFEYKEVPRLTTYDRVICNSTISIEENEHASIGNTEDTEYENDIPSDMSCFHRIQVPDKYIVSIVVSSNETNGVLRMYDGKHTHGNRLRVARNDWHGSLMSADRSVFLHFKKNKNKEDSSLLIDLYAREGVQTTTALPTLSPPSEFEGDLDCSNDSNNSPALRIKSPSVKFGFYPDNKHCVIVFQNKLDPNMVIQAEFLKFFLEESENCTFDSMAIFFGKRKESPSLGKFCGKSIEGKIIQSTGNIVKLEFHSDRSYGLPGYDIRISLVSRTDSPCPNGTVYVKQRDIISCVEGTVCKSSKCANGGTCVASSAEEMCSCLPGTSGDTCEVLEKDFQPLHFIDKPESELINKYQQYHRSCKVNLKDAQYRWYRNNELMTGSPELDMGILHIDNHSENDDGEYTCVAIFGTVHIEHYFKLLMRQSCDLGLYTRPVDRSQEVGEQVLLQCHFPLAVNYTWYKNKNKIMIEESSRYRLLPDGMLLIKDLNKADSGLYTCEGKGDSGCVSSFSAVLNVTDSDSYEQTCGISAYEDESSIKPLSGSQEQDSRIGPWHVMLINKHNGAVFCGGTLISKSWLVTAARCVHGFEKESGFTFDTNNVALHLGSKFCGKGDVIRSVRNYIVHESYDQPVPLDNDIAVIKMNESIDYKKTDEIKPICLEPEDKMNSHFLHPAEKNISTKTLVFGCGYIHNNVNRLKATLLQVVEIPIFSRVQCRTGMDKDGFTENMICGGSKGVKSGDICSGDIGSGWVMRTPSSNRWVLGGIASWGVDQDCGVDRFYSFYTHVGKYYNWIVSKTNFLADM